jgi:hypothetical protein
MSDESKVLGCLLKYKTDQMRDIVLPKYSYDYARLIAKLKHYPGKSLYHGHGTQSQGAPVADAAETNQTAAVNFLIENAPPATGGGNKKGGKHPQELINRNRTAMLLKIIEDDETRNLGEIDRKLSAVNPQWRQDRDVIGAYETLRIEKKNERAAKT